MTLDKFISVSDVAQAAARYLPKAVLGYVDGGTEDCKTLSANIEAIQNFQFRPKGLVGVSIRNQSTELFEQTYTSPIGIAPMGLTAMCRHECELALAHGAASQGIPFVLSGLSTVAMERFRGRIAAPWYQGYLPGDRKLIMPLMERLKRNEVKVLVVTIDTAVNANRENNLRAGFGIPFRFSWKLFLDGVTHPRWSYEVFLKTLLRDREILRFRNVAADTQGCRITDEPAFRLGRESLDWSHLAWIKDIWRGPVVVKGVAHPDDARKAASIGLDGLIISNHGGRQMDCVQGTLDLLTDVVNAVPASYPVMIDGGFRRGTDVLKAIGLGARMVFLGRPFLYGATVAGEAGVNHIGCILKAEIDRNMALLGCRNLSEVCTTLTARKRHDQAA